eukprot:767491-Hanusia_phi.AAC.8
MHEFTAASVRKRLEDGAQRARSRERESRPAAPRGSPAVTKTPPAARATPPATKEKTRRTSKSPARARKELIEENKRLSELIQTDETRSHEYKTLLESYLAKEHEILSRFLEESVRMKRDESANQEEQSLIKIAFEHRIAQLLTQITEKDATIRQSKLELAQFKEMTLNCMDEQHREWTVLLEENHSRQENLSRQCRMLEEQLRNVHREKEGMMIVHREHVKDLEAEKRALEDEVTALKAMSDGVRVGKPYIHDRDTFSKNVDNELELATEALRIAQEINNEARLPDSDHGHEKESPVRQNGVRGRFEANESECEKCLVFKTLLDDARAQCEVNQILHSLISKSSFSYLKFRTKRQTTGSQIVKES